MLFFLGGHLNHLVFMFFFVLQPGDVVLQTDLVAVVEAVKRTTAFEISRHCSVYQLGELDAVGGDDDLHLVFERLPKVLGADFTRRHDEDERFVEHQQPFQHVLGVRKWGVAHDDVAQVVGVKVDVLVDDFKPEFGQETTRGSVTVERLPDDLSLGDEVFNRIPGTLGGHVVVVSSVGSHG